MALPVLFRNALAGFGIAASALAMPLAAAADSATLRPPATLSAPTAVLTPEQCRVAFVAAATSLQIAANAQRAIDPLFAESIALFLAPSDYQDIQRVLATNDFARLTGSKVQDDIEHRTRILSALVCTGDRHIFTSSPETITAFETMIQVASEPFVREAPRFLTNCDGIIEFGPGDISAVLAKTDRLLKACPNARAYHAVDINRGFAERAAAAMLHDRPNLLASWGHSNFFRPANASPSPRASTASHVLCLLLGLTGGNFAATTGGPGLSEFVGHLFAAYADPLLVLSYDTNCDSAAQRAAYSGLPMARQWRENVETFQGAATGFRADDFEDDVTWDDEDQAIVFFVRARRNLTLRLDGRSTSIASGKTVEIGVSHKMTHERFEAQITAAGGCILLKTQHKSSDIAVALVGAAPHNAAHRARAA